MNDFLDGKPEVNSAFKVPSWVPEALKENEELRAVNKKLANKLMRVMGFIEEHVDTDDDSNGQPTPNWAMQLMTILEE